MKYDIIDWGSYWDDYPEEGEITFAKRYFLIDYIRSEGILFSGEDHQDEYGCIPIFNDGKMFITSRRGWGGIMAEAYRDYGLYDYSLYADKYSVPREECVYPDSKVLSPTDEDWELFKSNNYDGPDPFDMAKQRMDDYCAARERGEVVPYPGEKTLEERREQFDLTPTDSAQFEAFRRGKDISFTVPENSEFCRSVRYLDAGDTVKMTYKWVPCIKTVRDVNYSKVYNDKVLEEYGDLLKTDRKKAIDYWLSQPIKITISFEK